MRVAIRILENRRLQNPTFREPAYRAMNASFVREFRPGKYLRRVLVNHEDNHGPGPDETWATSSNPTLGTYPSLDEARAAYRTNQIGDISVEYVQVGVSTKTLERPSSTDAPTGPPVKITARQEEVLWKLSQTARADLSKKDKGVAMRLAKRGLAWKATRDGRVIFYRTRKGTEVLRTLILQREGFHHGLRRYRLPDNPMEKRFADEWEKMNLHPSRTLDRLLTDSDRPWQVQPRQARLAATVIQWLGSDVGQSFLYEVGFVLDTKKRR